jgi:sulfofructose kinase
MTGLPTTRASVLCAGMSGLDRIMQVQHFATEANKIYACGYDEVGGGPAATAAVAVQRLGGQAVFVGRVGSDVTGEAIRAELDAHGVDTRLLRTLAGAQSAASNVTVDAAGERQITHFPGAGLDVECDWVVAQDVEAAGAVLVDMGWRRGAQRILALARAVGVPSVLDADLSFDPRAVELLALADHVVFSHAALSRLSGSMDPRDGLAWAVQQVPGPYVGVTLGAQGYLWLQAGEVRHAAGLAVDVVDTLGAGDVFHGAYALAVAQGRGVAEAAAFANRAAAFKCTRASGRRGIPTRAQLDAWEAPMPARKENALP